MSQNSDDIARFLASSLAGERQHGIILAVKAGRVDLIAHITEIAGSDPDQETRNLARKALEHLQSVVQPSQTQTDTYAAIGIEKLLQADDPYARFAGLKKILTQKTPEARFLLLSALSKETVPQLLASFVIGVGHFHNPDDVKTLAPFLQNADARIRANTVEALAMIAGEEAYRLIIAVMGDEDNRVRANVVKALQVIGGQSLFELLKNMAFDERPWVRASAVFAFSRIKSPQSLVILARIAQSDLDPDIRSRALQFIRLEKADGNPAAASLLEKLETGGHEVVETPSVAAPQTEFEHRDFLVSSEAADRYMALTRIDKSSLPALHDAFIEVFDREEDFFLLGLMLNLVRDLKIVTAFPRAKLLLNHKDERVRANAVEAIGEIASDQAFDLLAPLLNDKNNRVVANCILVLKKSGRVDVIVELKKMLARGREPFKHSALYVLKNSREAMSLPLLERLIRDPNPRLRDKAFAVLKEYAAAKMPGAASLVKDVEKQIYLERHRDSFFENSLDTAFAGVVNLIKARANIDAEVTELPRVEKTPQAERTALLALADKCLQQQLADEKTLESLDILDREMATVDELISHVMAADSGVALPLTESARNMTERQLLEIEKKSMVSRREAVLVSFAFDFYNNRAGLDSRVAAQLRAELGRVEGSLCSLVPSKTFSMLPAGDASVSEIFDITMRLYQKHVYTFSLQTIKQFLKWGLGFALITFIGGFFMGISPPTGILFLIIFIPYFAWKSLGLMVEWKIMIALMVEDYIHGRELDKEVLNRKLAGLFKPVFDISLKKHLYLSLWLLIALFCSGSIVAAAGVAGRHGFLFSFSCLIALIIGMLIMASVYFKYLMVEPVTILLPGSDAFLTSERLFMKDRIKLASLFIFATFIMMIITGTSTQIITFFMPLLPQIVATVLIQVISLLSEVCLAPIVFSNVVVYCLMNRQKQVL